MSAALAQRRGALTRLADLFAPERGPIWGALLVAALALAPVAIGSGSFALHILMVMFLFATFGHAWNLMAGYAGLLTFGQQAFIGLGGFAEAMLVYYGHAPIWLAWLGSGLANLAFAWLLCLPLRSRGGRWRVRIGVAAAVAVALAYEAIIFVEPRADVFGSAYARRIILLLAIFLGALPLLRLRGAYFAIATWLIAESLLTVFNGWNVVGAGGGIQVKSDVTQIQLYYVALGMLTATTGGIWTWMRSTQGLALTAVRDDEDAAESSGVDVGAVKAVVFMFSATVTGLAAGLYFIDVVIVTPPSAFTISWAAYIVFVVVAGGMGTISGPILGAAAFVVIEQLLGAASGQGLLCLGVLSIALMLLAPRGFMGLVSDLRHRGAVAPSVAGSGEEPSS